MRSCSRGWVGRYHGAAYGRNQPSRRFASVGFALRVFDHYREERAARTSRNLPNSARRILTSPNVDLGWSSTTENAAKAEFVLPVVCQHRESPADGSCLSGV